MDKKSLARSSPAGLAWWHSGAAYSDDPADWQWVLAPHLSLLSQKIVDVATGRCPRLIVTMPPRHGKSELISKFAPAWFLGNFPDKKVMLASYADTFAAQWGRRSRDVLLAEEQLFGVQINRETSGGQSWEIAHRQGIMTTAGVGGGLTGKGAHLLIIDDPIKNAEEAHSELTREAQWNWWLSTARTRLQKGAGVILVMTRWHEDDLAGRFLANDPHRDKYGNLLPDGERRTDVEGDEWEILNLPAFAEPTPPVAAEGSLTPDLMATLTDEIGRKAGEVLWPEMFDAEWMNQTRRAQGSYWFSAMYQQRPSPAEGMLFKKSNFRYYTRDAVRSSAEDEPSTWLVTMNTDDGPKLFDIAYGTKFQTVDVAASEKQQADYTVVSTWITTPDGHLIWWDMEAQQFDTTQTAGFVHRKFTQHKPSQVCIERLGHGLAVINELVNSGLPIIKLEADTDKVSRALPVCARYEEHRVWHPQNAPWIEDAERQMLGFPNVKNDDIVDTVSYAGIKLPQMLGSGQFRTGGTTTHRGSRADREEVTQRTVSNSQRRARRRSHTAGLLHGEM